MISHSDYANLTIGDIVSVNMMGRSVGHFQILVVDLGDNINSYYAQPVKVTDEYVVGKMLKFFDGAYIGSNPKTSEEYKLKEGLEATWLSAENIEKVVSYVKRIYWRV